MRAADLGKSGRCHLFRHTAATLMVERGADIRYVQELLGHRDLGSTHIYTRVAPERLAAIHAATHPGAVLADGPTDATTDTDGHRRRGEVRHRQRALKGPPLALRITRDGFAALDRPPAPARGPFR